MIGKIDEIIDNNITINLDIDIAAQPSLINFHIIFEDGSNKKIVGVVVNVNRKVMIANIVGDITNGIFTPGASNKPSFGSNIRLINREELELIFGKQDLSTGYTNFGTSNVYEGYKINVPLNEFFNAHFAIIGNSGSGKSCAVASIIQKLFLSGKKPPINSSLLFFDAYGEYNNAFGNLHDLNSNLGYKAYTTNLQNTNDELIRIPIWLLDIDDLALLLDVSTPSQLPIIEKTLKLVKILTGKGEEVEKRKNDIIARAVQDIILSGDESTKIRDQVIGVMTKFNTSTLNLESQIVQPGYIRTFKQCLFVDKTGKMQEMELVVEFIRGYIIDEELDDLKFDEDIFYTLNDLEQAMEFALISEGVLKSNKVYDTSNIMLVRLHSLAIGENRYYFDYPELISRDEYIKRLLWDNKTNSQVQIINFNISYVDDRIAKVITKIISRMIFLKTANEKERGSKAYHIIIEEAHRYVRHDNDVELLGYNIFERISKEGRKYGVFLGLITQRPGELSDTCVSQCMNFVILRTLHPVDLKYLREMVPNVTNEIILQLKNLKPGNCIAFGSAFKVPTTMYIDMPNPRPLSNNVDLEKVWYVNEEQYASANTNNVQQIMQMNTIPLQQTNNSNSNSQYVGVQSIMQESVKQNRFFNAEPTIPQNPTFVQQQNEVLN